MAGRSRSRHTAHSALPCRSRRRPVIVRTSRNTRNRCRLSLMRIVRRWGNRCLPSLPQPKRSSPGLAASLPEWHRKNVSDPLFYAAISDVLASGKCATTTVPVALELIFKLPPSCRSLSRIPLIPTPGVPPDSMASRFPGGMPLPLSSTSRLSWPSERLMRILATGLSE